MAKLDLKVLGAGCKNCETLLKNTNAAVEEMGIEASVEYITDMKRIMTYGVMNMPALVIDGQVEAHGKVLKAKEIIKLLQSLGF